LFCPGSSNIQCRVQILKLFVLYFSSSSFSRPYKARSTNYKRSFVFLNLYIMAQSRRVNNSCSV
jgi:hypothetical protein